LSSSLLTGYAAAMLESKGYEVEIIEGYLDGLSYEDIERRITAARPDLLGVHLVYQWQNDLKLFKFLESVKHEGPSPYITIYGFYPTFAFEEILRSCPAIDSVILGEPEMTFAELAELLLKGGGLPDLAGLAVRHYAGGTVTLRRDPVADLDSLPFPVRTEAMFRLPEVNIQGSRGCYGKCTFCYINPFYGPASCWRARSPENIVMEIDKIVVERGRKEFYFTDPNFFGPGERGQKRALHLASLLKTRGIQFGIEARVNDIHDETIGALVEAGLRHILVGLESGCDRTLRRINKMTSVAQNERALAILRRHGLEPNVGFIMFEPDASLEDVRANFEFLRRSGLLENLPITANVLSHHQIVLRGTPAYLNLKEQGRLKSSSSAYEAVPVFVDHRVEVLSHVVRRLTNFLFVRLGKFWTGRLETPPDLADKYQVMNRLLVGMFEDFLVALESGERFSEEDAEALVREGEKKFRAVLEDCRMPVPFFSSR
jgi:radical SAM superfamily enzyme YgiQ (UPF0313 family)